MTPATVRAVQVAKAALMEAGRPDLAAGIHPSWEGWPAHQLVAGWCLVGGHPAGSDLILKAIAIGHQAAGHPVNLYVDPKCGHTHLRWPVPA